MIEGSKTINVKCDYKLNVDSRSLELVSTISAGDIEEEISRRILELEEEVIVESLIEMGWTPPEEAE